MVNLEYIQEAIKLKEAYPAFGDTTFNYIHNNHVFEMPYTIIEDHKKALGTDDKVIIARSIAYHLDCIAGRE